MIVEDSKWNGITSIAIVLIMILSSLIVLVPALEEAEGWYTSRHYANYDVNGLDISGNFYERYDGTRSGSSGTYAPTCGRNYLSNYRASVPINIGNLDERTYISTGSLTIYVYYYGYSGYLNTYLLGAGTLSDFSYDSIYQGRYVGQSYISSSGYHTLTLDNYDLQIIRNAVSNGDDYVSFGFRFTESSSSSSSYNYCALSSTSNTYIDLKIDNQPPAIPSLQSIDEYTEGSSVFLDWNTVSDKPSGTNYGNVVYQAGVFDNSSSTEPVYTSNWRTTTEYTFNSLNDGQKYFFRVRAKDGLGFQSVWSAQKTTTMDSTPPTTPGILPEPLYTMGTENSITWSPSTDTSSGIQTYVAITADNPEFIGPSGGYTTNNYYTFPNLVSGKTYYYLVYAMDNMDHPSPLSSVEQSIQDNTPPTAPIMINEPAYTKGLKNRFDWHPANDIGIGVFNYTYEVATSEDFHSGSIVEQGTVAETYFVTNDLVDGTRYWARVKARDGFGFESEWSRAEWSIQDETGPGELGLKPLMTYSPDEPVKLEWNGAEDGGTGTGWYNVQWTKDPLFATGVEELDHVVGHSYTISELDAGSTYYFKVTAFDGLGNMGEDETVLTTIDASPPTIPVISDLPEYSGGRSNLIEWSSSSDSVSGLDHYILNVYTSQFRVGLAFTVRTTDTEFEVPGLSDGTTYYYEVMAVDRAGNAILSELKHSMQDALGPSIPNMEPMQEYFGIGPVQASWEPSLDDSGEGVEYHVQVATNRLFTSNVHDYFTAETDMILYDTKSNTRSPSTLLPAGHYYIHMRAKDQFGQYSSYGPTMEFTIDTTEPDIPVLDEVNRYWGGSMVSISWEELQDDVLYNVYVLDSQDAVDPLKTSGWLDEISCDIYGLEGGREYWINVRAKDLAGLTSDPSDTISVFMDNAPPRLTIDRNGIFGGSDLYISGEAEDTQCGMGEVEISFDEGLTWENCELEEGKWKFAIPDAPEDVEDFMIRAIDEGGNIGDSIHGSIDLSDPEIVISYPTDGSEVAGAVQLMGSISDMNLESYKVEYKGPSDDWEEIIPMQTTSGFSGILGTWITSGLSGGEYTIKVTAEDKLGQVISEEITLNLAGASILLEPSMVSFSNSHPASGDKVTVMLTVTNLGESPAEGLTVTLYDGDEPIGTSNDVSVPAKGSTIVVGELSASGKHEITARISSGETGEITMSEPAILETTEDEMIMEDMGGILALIALILALVGIGLALFFGLRKAKEEEIEKAEPKDAQIREKPQEKKDDVRRAPGLGAPTTTPSRPQLPATKEPAQQNQQAALPNPTIAPVSEPKEKPQFQAPPPANKPEGDQVTYMSPNK